MPSTAAPVPHRPSRRAQIVEAAMRLHARQDGRAVTVAEIAREAYMSTPAIYYHYPSKDAVLLDGLSQFSAELVSVIREAGEEAVRRGSVADLVSSVVRWLDGRRHEAVVWYLTAPQVINADELRDELAAQTLAAWRAAVRASRSGGVEMADDEVDVVVVACKSLLEISAQSWLAEDQVRRVLGPKNFLAEVSRITVRLASGSAGTV
jgi:AcrR family transcriptional regulator